MRRDSLAGPQKDGNACRGRERVGQAAQSEQIAAASADPCTLHAAWGGLIRIGKYNEDGQTAGVYERGYCMVRRRRCRFGLRSGLDGAQENKVCPP
jgi:hypothetical protein